jgi:hypothetical protein
VFNDHDLSEADGCPSDARARTFIISFALAKFCPCSDYKVRPDGTSARHYLLSTKPAGTKTPFWPREISIPREDLNNANKKKS